MRIVETEEAFNALKPGTIIIDDVDDVCEYWYDHVRDYPVWIETGISIDDIKINPLLPVKVICESWER